MEIYFKVKDIVSGKYHDVCLKEKQQVFKYLGNFVRVCGNETYGRVVQL